MLFYKAYNNRLTCLHPTTAFLELKIYTSNWKCTQMWYLAHFWWQKVHAHTHTKVCVSDAWTQASWCYATFTTLFSEREVTLVMLMLATACGGPAHLLESIMLSCSAGGQAFLSPHMEPQRPHISAHSQLSHCSRTCYTTHDLTVISWKCTQQHLWQVRIHHVVSDSVNQWICKQEVNIDILDAILSVSVFLLSQQK